MKIQEVSPVVIKQQILGMAARADRLMRNNRAGKKSANETANSRPGKKQQKSKVDLTGWAKQQIAQAGNDTAKLHGVHKDVRNELEGIKTTVRAKSPKARRDFGDLLE